MWHDQTFESYVTTPDSFLARNRDILKYKPAKERYISNLQNWVNGSGSIARSEAAYLCRDDLMAASSADSDIIYSSFESFVADVIILLSGILRKV